MLVVKMLFIRTRLHDPLATKDSSMIRGRPQAQQRSEVRASAPLEWTAPHRRPVPAAALVCS